MNKSPRNVRGNIFLRWVLDGRQCKNTADDRISGPFDRYFAQVVPFPSRKLCVPNFFRYVVVALSRNDYVSEKSA